jgi:hypothetical protein
MISCLIILEPTIRTFISIALLLVALPALA